MCSTVNCNNAINRTTPTISQAANNAFDSRERANLALAEEFELDKEGNATMRKRLPPLAAAAFGGNTALFKVVMREYKKYAGTRRRQYQEVRAWSFYFCLM